MCRVRNMRRPTSTSPPPPPLLLTDVARAFEAVHVSSSAMSTCRQFMLVNNASGFEFSVSKVRFFRNFQRSMNLCCTPDRRVDNSYEVDMNGFGISTTLREVRGQLRIAGIRLVTLTVFNRFRSRTSFWTLANIEANSLLSVGTRSLVGKTLR